MSYQMIHMEIAFHLLHRFPGIFSHAEFIVGSIAPDSVHMNPNYDVSLKVASHLFEGCGEWSDTQDYERWNRNITEFWHKYWSHARTKEEKSFIAGICVHCFTDYSNDLYIWRKLQKENIPPMTLEEFRQAYYPEAKGIDQWLYQNSEHRSEIKELLAVGHTFEIGDLLNAEQIELQRQHLLHVQYDTEIIDISKYRFLSGQKIIEFIEHTVNAIEEVLTKSIAEKYQK